MSALEFKEGVRYATAVIREACDNPGSVLPTVMANLEESMAKRPEDFAKGVRHVLVEVTRFLSSKARAAEPA